MNYILKRDLPFAKAGDKVFSCDVGFYCFVKPNMPVMLPEMMNDKGLTYIGTREMLLKEGWVEEAKPREWYELIIGEQLNQRIRFNTLREAMVHNETYFEFKNYDIIKVREVIE